VTAEGVGVQTGVRSGDDPLSVRARPSSIKCDCARWTTSTGGKCPANVHAKSHLILETSADTPVRKQGPGRSLPGPDAGHPLHATGGHEAVSMTRNIRGMILTLRGTSDPVRARRSHNSLGSRGGLQSRERARRVPDEVVDRGSSRSLPRNTAGTATRLDAREPNRRGDLTRKRSSRQPAVPHTCHTRQRPAVSHGHSPPLTPAASRTGPDP
jgi:hypothetical protein